MKWRDQFYVDLAFPFGMRLAPFIFNSMVDMVQWILLNCHCVSDLSHYLISSLRGPRSPLYVHKTLHSSLPHRWCNMREIEALIGHFQHAAKVVWPRRTFLRRMTDLLCCFCNKKHPIHLNREFRLDLQWWQLFLSSCNGVGF